MNTKQLKFPLSLIFIFPGLILIGCNTSSEPGFTLVNSTEEDFIDAPVSIPFDRDLVEFDVFTLVADGKEIPYQLDDLDSDGTPETLFLLYSLKAGESSKLTFRESKVVPDFKHGTRGVIKVRDQADPENMQVSDDFELVAEYTEPFDLQADNGLLFFEGPGWESEYIGYRFYFDDRNRFDVFGKSETGLNLAEISSNYHEREAWGADVLKVGSSLGIGAPALFRDGSFRAIETTGTKSIRTIADGPLRTILEVSYPDWEVDGEKIQATMELEIHARHRYSIVRLTTDIDEPVFATGLVTHPNAPEIDIFSHEAFTTAYTWGDQSDLNEGLALGLVLSNSENPTYEGEINDTHVFSLNGKSGMEYMIMAAWELEPEYIRIQNEPELTEYMNRVGRHWASPISTNRDN